jgi:hypothetical protein
MKPNTDTTQKPIQLEQLLRLKRAEKPDDAFWEQFDRELHGRMLRTLVNSESQPGAWFNWLRSRWIQAGAVGACAAFVALFAIKLNLSDAGSSSPAESLAMDFPVANSAAVESLQMQNPIAVPVQSDVAVERLDFGIGQVATAKPSNEATISREFGANAVRVAAASHFENYSMDYATDSVFGGLSMRGQLVY